MFSFFLQAVQQITDNPVSTSTLMIAIGTALVGMGGLLTWAVKTVIPKLIENFDKRTDSMVNAMKAIPDTIDGLKDTMINLKEAMVNSNNTVIRTVETAKNEIIHEVKDEKIKLLLIKDK